MIGWFTLHRQGNCDRPYGLYASQQPFLTPFAGRRLNQGLPDRSICILCASASLQETIPHSNCLNISAEHLPGHILATKLEGPGTCTLCKQLRRLAEPAKKPSTGHRTHKAPLQHCSPNSEDCRITPLPSYLSPSAAWRQYTRQISWQTAQVAVAHRWLLRQPIHTTCPGNRVEKTWKWLSNSVS